ncbi:MAG: coproporphyrinogen III oxidase, partial [Sphingomonas sp.]|nr:coproporphyrinogen III oxidase [Sphingomonas sp.]
PENWLSAMARNGHGIEIEDALSPSARRAEALLMGLRLAEGIDLARIAALSGEAVDDVVDARAAATLEAEGLIAREGTTLRATEPGMLVLNALIAALVPDG